VALCKRPPVPSALARLPAAFRELQDFGGCRVYNQYLCPRGCNTAGLSACCVPTSRPGDGAQSERTPSQPPRAPRRAAGPGALHIVRL